MRILALLFLLICASPVAAQSANGASGAEAAESPGDVEALIQILENDQARTRLIQTLRQAETEEAAEEATPTGVLQIGEYARAAVESSAAFISAVVRLSGDISDVLTGTTTVDFSIIWNAVRTVIVVAVVTFSAFFLLRLGFLRIQRALAAAAAGSGPLRRSGLILASALFDTATVLLAWAAGYVPAIYFDLADRAGGGQTLFLGAFLSVELAKVVARVLLAPRWPALRFLRIGDTTSAYWYFWSSRLLSILGYAFLFLAPLLASGVSYGAAQVLRAFVLFCALTMACIIIMQNRDLVRSWLMLGAERVKSEVISRALSILARFWNVVAIAYLILIFGLWLADHEAALPFVLTATAQTFIAIAIGTALTMAVTRIAAGGMHLPDDIRTRVPLLEQRLNAFVPNVLRVTRGVIVIGVIIASAQIWLVADFLGWISSEVGQRIVTSILSAGIILIAGSLIYIVVQSWVEYRLDPPKGSKPSARERTLLSLFRNAFTVALGVLTCMLVLSELGVNIAPLLAGAGILGLAVGFGAQKLVQDIITGAFIQFENAMNEGDVVTAGGVTGTVERLTIRSVSLRSLDGAYHLIPFSSVDSVSNFMKNFSYHVANIGVDYGVSVPEVKRAMQDAFERLKKTEEGEHIIGELEMHGVTEFGDSAIMVRARIKTQAGRQWAIGRLYNEIIKELFEERGIEIPFPHVTLNVSNEDLARLTKPLMDSTDSSEEAMNSPAKAKPRAPRNDGERPAVAAKRLRSRRPLQDGPPDDEHDLAEQQA
ncbi:MULTISPECIES: mechanosensitive ion channel domain-containing protein [Chelativorans]|jgi:small conductance mechanosensitive channel|uniref:MscS Mechanosensitive ion channel n=1 Tax=Chelativorans sp. (strain BNC1) TaxID=266779 RepID=Q11IC2_CHESB|nr:MULTISPECIES: mechanosensitive ion channel domain-containing protein [Chelativorans]